MAELKPCPFCGNNQHLNYVELSNGLHYIECARCGAAPHRLGAWNRETAVKYWNSVNRWIPCEERLPEVYEKVLTYSDDGIIHDNFRLNLRDGSVGWSQGWGITHWQPRPEPPEKEDADDT